MAHVLHNACIVDGVKVNVMSAIDIMVESLKRIILDASTEKLKLPMILPVESMEGITEWDYLLYLAQLKNGELKQSIQGFESFYITMAICELHRKCICG